MKTSKGVALITILLIIMLMMAFITGLSFVTNKNLQFFSFMSGKTTARSLALSGMDYMAFKTAGAIAWNPVSANVRTTGELRVDNEKPYYFEIQDDSSLLAEYRFIGIVKDAGLTKNLARVTLRVKKTDVANLRKKWTEGDI